MEEDEIELKDVRDFTASEGLFSDFLYQSLIPVSEEFERLCKCREEDLEIDALIRVDDKTFHAHKTVLLESSPTLKHFFTSGECLEESPDVQTFQLCSKFMDQSVIGPLLDYFYTGKLRISNSDIRSLCVAVHYLQLPVALLQEIEIILISQVSNQTVLSLYKLSHRCDLEKLREKCLKTIAEDHEEILKGEEFLGLSSGNLKELIMELRELKPEVKVEGNLKEQLFHFIIRWAESENVSTKRPASLSSLLQALPLEQLSHSFLEKQIINNHTFLMMSSYFCSRLFIDWLNKLSDPEHEVSKRRKTGSELSMSERFVYIRNINHFTRPERLTNEPLAGDEMSVSSQKAFAEIVTRKMGWILRDPFKKYTFGFSPNTDNLKPPAPESRRESGQVKKEKLFCLGGLGSDEEQLELSSISSYDPATNQWESLKKGLKNPRYNFAAAVVNGHQIYTAGGYSGSDQKLDSFEVFDTQSGQWSELCPVPEARAGSSMAFLNDFLYLAGGEDSSNLPTSSVLRYEIETGTWTEVKPMNRKRSGLKLLELSGSLYAVGGKTNTVEKYDPETDQWSMETRMNYYQESFGATVHQGSIYICGPNNFQVYSPSSSSLMGPFWKLLPSLEIGQGCELVSIDGKLLAIGGCEAGTLEASNEVFEFNFFTKEWIPRPLRMDTARMGHSAVVCYSFSTLL